MNYWRSVKFIFGNEQWWLNPLIAWVCFFVPIVGPLVFMGYLVVVIENFHRAGTDEQYEVFDFDHLVNYLKRGVWPFIVEIILALLMLPFIFILTWATIGLAAILAHNDMDSIVAPLAVCLGSLAFVAIALVISFVSLPATLGCALTQDLKSGLAPAFICGFLKKCWLEMLLAYLFIMLLSILIVIPTALTCGLGAYPCAGLLMMSQWHLRWQLYELYLKRGGTPLNLKEPENKGQLPA